MQTLLRVQCPADVPMRRCVSHLSQEVAVPRNFCGASPAPIATAHNDSSDRRRQRGGGDDQDVAANNNNKSSATTTNSSGRRQPCDHCLLELCQRVDSQRIFFASTVSASAAASAETNPPPPDSVPPPPAELCAAAARRGNVAVFGRLPHLPESQRLQHTHASRAHFVVEQHPLLLQPHHQQQQQQQSSTAAYRVPLPRVQHVFRSLVSWLSIVPKMSALPPCDHRVEQQEKTGEEECELLHVDDVECEAFWTRCSTAAEQMNRWLSLAATASTSSNNNNNNSSPSPELLTITATSMQNDTFLNGKPLPRWIPVPLFADDVIDVLSVPTTTATAPHNNAQDEAADEDSRVDLTPSAASPMMTARCKNREALPRFVVALRERSPERPMSMFESPRVGGGGVGRSASRQRSAGMTI